MLFVRVLAVALKPALAVGVVASVAGGVVAWQQSRDDGATPFQQVQSAGQRLIVSEFGEARDTVVAVDPADGSRTTIARVDHAPGYGIFATLAPDGGAIAYTALPPDTERPGPGAPAVAGIVEADGATTLLAADVDLLIPPVWSPDGQSIVVRRNESAEDDAGRFELVLLGRDGSRSVITTWNNAAVFPVAFSPDGGTLYFATLAAAGSDLYRVAPDGSDETLVAHLHDDITRYWRLSPDGATLAYSAAFSGAQPRVATLLLDLAAGGITDATPATARDEYNPAWTAAGELTLASVDGAGASLAVDAGVAPQTITTSDDSIDLPLAWSPDGDTLAVRAVEGPSSHEAGRSAVELVKRDGTRTEISDIADVLIVGWME